MANTPIANVPGSSQTAGATQPQHVMIVDTNGNPITAFGGSGGTAQADKSGFTEGVGQGTPAFGVYNESLGANPSEDSAVALRATIKRALHVNLRDAAGAEVSFSNVQYTEGDTDSTITGTAFLFEDSGDTLRAVSAAKPLPTTTLQQLVNPTDLTEVSIDFNASGDNNIVAGTALQTVRLWGLFFVVAADVNIRFKDGAGSNLTGLMTMFGGGSFFLPFMTRPWFTTSAGNALILNLSGAVQVSGRAYYVKN